MTIAHFTAGTFRKKVDTHKNIKKKKMKSLASSGNRTYDLYIIKSTLKKTRNPSPLPITL